MDNTEPQKNDCSKCKHSQLVPGSSHHRKCNAFPPEVGISLLKHLSTGRIPSVKMDDVEKVVLSNWGVKNGWAFWPINFDPIWITCTLTKDDFKALGHGE